MACEQQQQKKGCSSSVELQLVKVSCKQHPDYALGIREGKVKMVCFDIDDNTQKWERVAVASAGRMNLCLVNRATGQAIAHPNCDKEEVYLTPYKASCVVNESIIWNQDLLDVGNEYRALRSASDHSLNMDLFEGQVGECSRVGMWKWNGGDNQLWNMSPLPVPIPPCPC